MFKWLKRYFIPHKKNDYKPHVIREASTAAIFSIVVILFIASIGGRVFLGAEFTALVLPKILVDYANEDRDAKNYKHLAINPVLEKAAQLKANDMADKGYFAHKSPEGKTPWYWFEQAGYDFSYAGENLAVNFNDSVDVNNAWMNSPGHRDNIMNGNFTEIGIATANGLYQGKQTTFVVQLFGTPAKSQVTSVKNTPVKKNETKTNNVAGTTTSSVLSESVSSEVLAQNGTNEMFVSVKKESAPSSAVDSQKHSTYFQRVLLSRDNALTVIYLFFALIISIGLITTAFVEFRSHNTRRMFLALGLLVVIFGLLYVYKSIVIEPLLIA